MAKVRKGNRILTVDAARLDSYLKHGYDEIDEQGGILKRATGGKTVTVGEYNKALDVINQLKAEIEEKGDGAAAEELEKLRAENKDLKAQLTAAKKSQGKDAAPVEGAKGA